MIESRQDIDVPGDDYIGPVYSTYPLKRRIWVGTEPGLFGATVSGSEFEGLDELLMEARVHIKANDDALALANALDELCGWRSVSRHAHRAQDGKARILVISREPLPDIVIHMVLDSHGAVVGVQHTLHHLPE